MKISCSKAAFSEAVSVVSRVVPARSSIPALEGILIRARVGEIELFGYDLDIGISTDVEATVEEYGDIILPAKILLDIAKRLPGERVTLTVGDKCLTEIKSGAAEYTIRGISAEEFAEFPAFHEDPTFSIGEGTLCSMIGQTLYAVSQSDSKPVHTGSLFDIEDGFIKVVSVDGYRLALRKEKVNFSEAIRFVVPGRALSEVARILDPESDSDAEVFVSKKHIFFKNDRFCIYTRLLEGDFLDYESAIPKNGQIKVRVSTRDLTNAVDRVSLLINDRIRSPLRVKFEEREIRLACSTALGRASDVLDANTVGGTIEMGFNNRYLLDALKNTACDEIMLEISGALAPMKVLPVEGDDFTFLVLPVRLKTEG